MGKKPWKGTMIEIIKPRKTFDCTYCEDGWCNKKSINCTKYVFNNCKQKEKPRISSPIIEKDDSFNVEAFVEAARKVNTPKQKSASTVTANLITAEIVGKKFMHKHMGTGHVYNYDAKYLYIILNNGT